MANLLGRINGVIGAAQTLPRIAAAKLRQLEMEGVRAQKDPEGVPWAPTEGREAKSPAAGAKFDAKRGRWRLKGRYVPGGWGTGAFDPEHHITHETVINGTEVRMNPPSDERLKRAEKFTRAGTKWMPSRAKTPKQSGLGSVWWGPKLISALRWHIKNGKRAL